MIHERDSLTAVTGHYQQLEKTVVQRLKWAAGANPALGQALLLFEETLNDNTSKVEVC